MSFSFGGQRFATLFPAGEAIQREYPNISGLGVDSLAIPRMERRRFLETTRPRTQLWFDVILHGDTEAAIESARQQFLRWVDPTLGPQRLVLDEDPQWYWDMTPSEEIVWERLTWACDVGGYRLRATVTFESFNDAAARRVGEEPAPGVVNLAPPIVGSGQWAEVRRNLVPSPEPDGAASMWTGNGAAGGATTTVADTTEYPELLAAGVTSVYRVTGGTPSANFRRGFVFSNLTVGTTYTFMLWSAHTELSRWFRLFTGMQPSDLVADAEVSWEGGERGWRYLTWTATQTEVRAFAVLRTSDTNPDSVFDVAAGLVIEGEYSGPFFCGSTPDLSVDPDMRTRWLGEPNASESVMEIEQVAGLTATNCVAGVSTRDGKPAVRLIPNSVHNDSFVHFIMPVGDSRNGGVILGTRHQDQVISGATLSRYLVAATGPFQLSAGSNAVGSFDLRLAYSALSTLYQARWYHSGSQGSGEVWWTDIGIYAGDYSGDWTEPGVSALPVHGNTRTWPTIQFQGTLSAAQEARVTINDFEVRVAGPLTSQDIAVLDYQTMRFEVFRAGVKIASLVPRMSTLDRCEIRAQDELVTFDVSPVSGGTISNVMLTPNSRKQ